MKSLDPPNSKPRTMAARLFFRSSKMTSRTNVFDGSIQARKTSRMSGHVAKRWQVSKDAPSGGARIVPIRSAWRAKA